MRTPMKQRHNIIFNERHELFECSLYYRSSNWWTAVRIQTASDRKLDHQINIMYYLNTYLHLVNDIVLTNEQKNMSNSSVYGLYCNAKVTNFGFGKEMQRFLALNVFNINEREM